MEKPKLSPIKEMEIRSSKIPGVVSLAQGVPSFEAPKCIKNKVIEAIQQGKTDHYSLSPGLLELREAIEYSLSKEDINYDFEKEIIITAGSIEGITASLLALINPGDEVLIPDPTYTSYQEAVKVAKGKPVFVPLKEETGWSFDVNELIKKITDKTKVILFCNPNNPTGTVFNQNQIIKILEIAQYHNLFVLADEVYRDFIYDGQDFFSIGKFSEFRKRIVYIFSFSKAYSMTGWRVAYLAADEEIVRKILAVHDALVTCAPVISQWGALAALEMADQDVSYFKREFIKRKNTICFYLDEMRDWLEYKNPDSAYFVFPRLKEKLIKKIEIKNRDGFYNNFENLYKNSNSWNFALELLYKAKLASVPGLAFGRQGENHLRFCFGRKMADIEEGMKRLRSYLNKI